MKSLEYIDRAFHIARICLKSYSKSAYRRLRKQPDLPGPQRLRMLLENLGGSFVKFGQILSLQLDILPKEYCNALLTLLDRVPPFAKDEVRQIFAEELGKFPEDLFDHFDYKPVASASIGQVHQAVLRDATRVAIKVQRPDAREEFLRDAALLRFFVRFILLFRIRTLYFMRDPVREFNEWVLEELDYRREAAYAEVLWRNARNNPAEAIPKVYREFTTSRILTMEFLEGCTAMDYLRAVEEGNAKQIAHLKTIGFDAEKFVSNVIGNFLSDAFRHGLFHADLHPANLLILKDNVVGYVDFGIVGNMTPVARRKQIQLSMAYAQGRSEEIFAAFMDISSCTAGADPAGFRRELEKRSQQWYRVPAIAGVPHLNRSLTVAMFDLLALCRTYGFLVDREMIKYIRSLILSDGLVTRLAPGFDLAPQIRTICEDFLSQEAKARIFSEGAALTLLAGITGWMLGGPGRALRAVELLEIGVASRKPEPARGTDGQEALRLRAYMVTSSWMVAAVLLISSRETLFSSSLWSVGYLMAGLWGGCTIWLISLMRKLANR
ncbi:MAG: hypothetical protein A3F68_10530 [Acidobacteria bacterium RIFCSPLOWO2_12_FULL_54_10]|nr:MAG: hypothetical protein A3F68_10530 [Acidobacteria bacterium RIFCSPLOWO2_12_FULL_54_10]